MLENAPAVRRWAPSRLGSHQPVLTEEQVLPRPTAGSIAARPATSRPATPGRCSRRLALRSIVAARSAASPRRPARMLPPLSGGLHCGYGQDAQLKEIRAGASAVRRRAPLRRGAGAGLDPLTGSVPVVRRRAPLRRAQEHLADIQQAALPALDGGLHCGSIYEFLSHYKIWRAPAVRRRAPGSFRPVPL
jgi:predicted lipid-binding transport protein (Tim44 family)